MTFIFAPFCYSKHWLIWVADVRKRKFYILDPYHKTCSSEAKMKLNKFVEYVISRMRVYAGGHLSGKKIMKLNHHTLTSQAKKYYDCDVYPENIRNGKYEWDNWTQIIVSKTIQLSITLLINRAEVDHFRVEFASRILFHEMNRDRDEAIRGSEAMRLSKPSSLLLSPYCQIDSYDIESD
ncbi:hypothetical protein Ahy_A03g013720 [Arachis hypogaea]|uniref:Ubiquitin-like protease family profile domain-containing protein n=1 Tax=Arachis hypogaea TaxID=3818 RepID=A0A445DW07_ARAHY|nr:hypothetical protein Ahy_A03g013720 [Arachis hypogaea]